MSLEDFQTEFLCGKRKEKPRPRRWRSPTSPNTFTSTHRSVKNKQQLIMSRRAFLVVLVAALLALASTALAAPPAGSCFLISCLALFDPSPAHHAFISVSSYRSRKLGQRSRHRHGSRLAADAGADRPDRPSADQQQRPIPRKSQDSYLDDHSDRHFDQERGCSDRCVGPCPAISCFNCLT